MSKPNNLIGQRFGKLIVLERAENDKFGKTRWLCQCDCGNQKIINGSSLLRGLTVSCGCNKLEKLKKYNEKQVVDETGHIYGLLTVINRNYDESKDGRAMWNCQCECGNKCVVSGKNLRSGAVSSCGCLISSKGELTIEKLLKNNNINFSREYLVDVRKEKIYQHHKARFDFAIFQQNQLSYFIEYDGEQHFTYKNYNNTWNTKEALQKTQGGDQIKNQWCKENNIPLIRIPYWHLQDLCIEDLLLETSDFIVK